MSVPNNPDKYGAPSVLTAADVLAHRSRNEKKLPASSPEAVILCYQRGLMSHVVKRYQTKKIGGFFGDLYVLHVTRGQVGVCGNFGPGAPIVATLVEELVASGAHKFLSIGIAGGLQLRLKPGDVVVCDRAIRDEGTSQHYLPSSRFVEASQELIDALTRALNRSDLAFSIGGSWTTDAPYRETRAEVEGYQQEDVQTVEMEAAALYAVGQYLKVQTAAAFVISDSLADLRWEPAPDGRVVQKRLQTLFDAAVQVFVE